MRALLPSRDLTVDELTRVACALAAEQESWRPYVRHNPEQRTYHPLLRTPHVSAWLICWMPGHDTGFHDHDGAAGAVAVARGTIREERLALTTRPVGREVSEGGVIAFGPYDIHRVLHAGEGPAVTIHAYSPRLRRMGAYSKGEDGLLLRRAMDEDEELVGDRGDRFDGAPVLPG
jgi:predicted metal-dependent enzyme (double-stranded beta helix superfamily)